MEINDLVVEYPHGAGGKFLSSVLACCITNVPWQPQTVNYHRTPISVKCNHAFDPAPNIISIDDPGARYNFWINYFKKRVIYELEYYRYNNCRWIKCPYEELDSPHDAFWLINQCRFIISYQSQQPWHISWSQMLTDPASVWKIVQEYLEATNQPNYWTLSKWSEVVEEYRRTLPTKITMNTNHIKWKIWAVSLLQERGIIPNFDIIANFRKPKFLTWLDKHNQDLLEITKQYTWTNE